MTEANVDTRSDGIVYTNPAMIAKRASRRNGIQIALDHPDWNLMQVLEEQRKVYPTYTEAALRQALRDAGVPRSKPRPVGVKYGERKPKAPKKPEPIRAAVHGYHGRSRLLGSYEL
jgi:hypothetical protein